MRSAALARASMQNLAGLAAPLVVALVTVPFVVRALGPERFGIVALAWTIAGYFALFDLGLGRAVTKLGAEALAEVDVPRLHGMVVSAVLLQLTFGAVAALGIAAGAAPLARVLNVSPGLLGTARDSFRVLACAIPAILIANTYRGALEAAGRFDLVNALRAPLSSAVYLATLAGAFIGFGPLGIVALIALTRIAAACAFVIAFHRALRLPFRSRSHFAWRPLVGFGSWVSLTSVLVPITAYIDRFLVGAFASVAAVAYYAAPYELASKLLIVPGSIAAVLLPSLSQSLRLREVELALEQTANAFAWSTVVLFLVAALLIVGAEPVLGVWLGADYQNQSTLAFRLLLIAVYLNGLALLPFTLLESAGRPDLVTKYHLIELPIYLAVTVPLVQLKGIEGAALAWVIRNAAGVAVLLWLAAWVRRCSIAKLIGARSATFALSGATLLAASVIALQSGLSPWIALTVNASALLLGVRLMQRSRAAAAASSPAV